MRQILLVQLLVILILLSSCQKPVSKSEDNYRLLNETSAGSMAETADGYYTILNGLMYYGDKETMEWVILCSRPECDHTDSNNCSASASGPFTIMDEYIYSSSVSSIYYLAKMRLDGSKHEELGRIDEIFGDSEDIRMNGNASIYDYQGIRYFCHQPLDDGTKKMQSADIWSIPLDRKTAGALIGTFESEGRVYFVGIPCEKAGYMGMLVTTIKDSKYYQYCFLYHIKEQRMEIQWEGFERYSYWFGEDAVYYYVSGEGMYKKRYDSQERDKIADISASESSGAVFNGQVMLVVDYSPNGTETFYDFYDMKGHFYTRLTSDEPILRYVGMSEDIAFFEAIRPIEGEQEGVGDKVLLYVSLEMVKSGTASFVDVSTERAEQSSESKSLSYRDYRR